MASLRVEDKTCHQCGIRYRGRGGKTRKYCGVCQAHRDMSFLGDRATTCMHCEKTFYPYRANHKVCYACSDVKAGIPTAYPPCETCGEHNRLAPGLEKACCVCVQKDVKSRAGYLRKLTLLIKERLANPTTTQEAAA